MSKDIPLPDAKDHEFAPYWEGTRNKELRVPKCNNCGNLRWPPRPMCPICHSFEVNWISTSGKGHLFSWTVVWHTTLSGYQGEIPYVVALIELDDAPARLIGHIINYPIEELKMGLPLKVVFKKITDDIVLPEWEVGKEC